MAAVIGSSRKLRSSIVKWFLGFWLGAYFLICFWSIKAVHNGSGKIGDGKFPSNLSAVVAKPSSLETLSSVDYFACCGLGHRLIRMSLAHYIAKLKGFTLRSFWGWCGEQRPIEVFSYLFHPYDLEDVRHVTSQDWIIPFYNEVLGFNALARTPTNGNLTACSCHADKIEADFELYSSLRRRFRDRPIVDAFVKKHFEGHSVIGIHVRAGNGEGGDFVRKGRTIENPDIWVRHVCHLIQNFLREQREKSLLSKPPVLYIATDTPSMVTLFRQELESAKIAVLELPQQGRREEGQGVLFGESDKVHNRDGGAEIDDYSACLQGWSDTLTDMFLLSHSDVVIAGKPSSFSQTLPMSLAFGNQVKKVGLPYCEVLPQFEEQIINSTTTVQQEVAPTMQCYKNYMDWCCNYSTWIRFHHKGPKGRLKIHAKEFVRFLLPDNRVDFAQKEYRAARQRSPDCPRPRRGRAGGGLKDKCLPHQW